MGKREYARLVNEANKQLDEIYGPASKLSKGLKALPYVSVGLDALMGVYENCANGEETSEIIGDAIIDVGVGATGVFLSSIVSGAVSGAIAGSAVPGIGNIVGLAAGLLAGIGFYIATEVIEYKDKSLVEWADEGIDRLFD